MRLIIHATACFVVGYGFVATLGAAPPEKGARGESAAELFAWFDTLGYPDVSKSPFVRITTTWTPPPQTGFDSDVEHHYGFAIKKSDSSEQVFVVDALETRTFTPNSQATREKAKQTLDPADLENHVNELIADYVRRHEFDLHAVARFRIDERLDERSEFFTLAWAASRRGLTEPAARLFELVAKMPRDLDDEGRERTLREILVESVAEAEIWNGTERFGDPAVPRTELLRHFRRMAATFPKTRHHEQMRETADMLVRMVKEDEERARRPPVGKLEDLPLDKRVAELIYQLRDQVGGPPGCATVYNDFTAPDDDANSPSRQLLRIGFDAVPQLLDAIDDKRFTRSVGNCGKGLCFAHYLHTVGGFAQSLIDEIAGRSFYPPYDPNRRTTPEEDGATEKKAIRDWYDDVRRKGEKAVLSEAVRTGTASVDSQASRLAEKYPADAASAIISRIKQERDLDERASLIAMLAPLEGPEIVPFLLEEVRSKDADAAYLSAARVLHRHGRPEGVTAMVKIWEQSAEAPEPWKSRAYRYYQTNSIEGLATFLVRSGRSAAVRAVADKMHRFPRQVRSEIIRACNRDDRDPLQWIAAAGTRRDADYNDAALALLMRALEFDEERHEGMTVGFIDSNQQIESPRTCDLAGRDLHSRDPARYPFDAFTDMVSRDRARYAIIDAWRKENGLPPRVEKKPKPPTQVTAD